jgi:hypothetical protein
MIKALHNSDFLVTPFTAQKTWQVDTFDSVDLLLWQSQSYNADGTTSSFSGSLAVTYIDYGDNSAIYPITNSYCSIANQQQNNQFVKYQRGILNVKYISSSTSDITIQNDFKNWDGSSQGLVYEQNKHLFYNNFNNFTKTFGMESADLSDTNRLITNTMDVFTIPSNKLAGSIVKNTVKIVDKSLDKEYQIVDDGNCNLYVSGSVFSAYETNNLSGSKQLALSVKLFSYNLNGNKNYTQCPLLFLNAAGISYVSSSNVYTEITGGNPPYSYQWYISGDYSDFWNLYQNENPFTNAQYKNLVSQNNPLYYKNTYLVCVVTDVADNQVVSNYIYFSSGSSQ